MNEQEVVALMKSSKSEREWNANADKVKKACGGYPGFWWNAIMVSGVAHRVANAYGSDAEIHLEVIKSSKPNEA
jgi:hypothetical protein